MLGASIISLLGGLLALLAPLVLPFITVDEDGTILRSFHAPVGIGSLVLSLAVVAASA